MSDMTAPHYHRGHRITRPRCPSCGGTDVGAAGFIFHANDCPKNPCWFCGFVILPNEARSTYSERKRPCHLDCLIDQTEGTPVMDSPAAAAAPESESKGATADSALETEGEGGELPTGSHPSSVESASPAGDHSCPECGHALIVGAERCGWGSRCSCLEWRERWEQSHDADEGRPWI